MVICGYFLVKKCESVKMQFSILNRKYNKMEQPTPEKIIVIEHLNNEEKVIHIPTNVGYRAILFENVTNCKFILPQKHIKVLMVRCKNVQLHIQESIFSTLDIFLCQDIIFSVVKDIPIITIEQSKMVEIHSQKDLNILNSFSDDIYIKWRYMPSKIKMPLIMFSNHWMWQLPINTDWTDWSRQEVKFLIQNHLLYIRDPGERT